MLSRLVLMFSNTSMRSDVEQAAAPVAYSTRSLTERYRLFPSAEMRSMHLRLIRI